MFNNVLVRLTVHYVASILFFAGLFRVFPQILTYVANERARSGAPRLMDLEMPGSAAGAVSTQVEGVARLLDPQSSIPVLMALLAAFLLALPVVWVYRWTRPRKRYSQAFAHTILVVPIAIALVVFLVKGSLPLAFSLAGIVAAMRFRTALSEPMDAVYMFIVIGIGLAAGVQLVVVATLASIAFNVVALTVWRTDFGAQPAILSGWSLVKPGDEGQLLGVSGELHAEMPGAPETAKSPYTAMLRLHTTRVEAAQRTAIPVLDANAKNWRIAQVIHNEDGTSIVEFDVRLKKSADLAAFIREIEQEKANVGKVELKKYKPRPS